MDINGKITYSNPAFQQITGYNQPELKTKSIFELTHPEDRHTIKQVYKNLLECKTEKTTIEIRKVRKDDKIIPINLNITVLTTDETAHPVEFITTIEEITTPTVENKQLQEKLKTSEERFQNLLNNSIDYVYRHNLQTGQYEYASPASKRIVGYEPEEMMNMSNEEVLTTVHPDDLPKLQTDLARIIKDGKGFSEYRLRRKDGTYIWYRNNMNITYDATGRPLYRDGIGQDITALKEAQAKIDKLKKQIANQTTPSEPTNKTA